MTDEKNIKNEKKENFENKDAAPSGEAPVGSPGAAVKGEVKTDETPACETA